MSLFKKPEEIVIQQQLIQEIKRGPIIKEKNTVIEAIREINNFQLIPVADLPIATSLELAESIVIQEKEALRTDFIIVPKCAVLNVSKGRVGFDTSLMYRLDNLIEFFRLHINWSPNRYSESANRSIGKHLETKRIVTADGWELYTVNGIELLEVQSTVCRRCASCHEQRFGYRHDNKLFEQSHHWGIVTIRDIRNYVLYQPLLNVLFMTGLHIVKVKHPCEVRSLHEIISMNENIVGVDPPEMEIVFPKEEYKKQQVK